MFIGVITLNNYILNSAKCYNLTHPPLNPLFLGLPEMTNLLSTTIESDSKSASLTSNKSSLHSTEVIRLRHGEFFRTNRNSPEFNRNSTEIRPEFRSNF